MYIEFKLESNALHIRLIYLVLHTKTQKTKNTLTLNTHIYNISYIPVPYTTPQHTCIQLCTFHRGGLWGHGGTARHSAAQRGTTHRWLEKPARIMMLRTAAATAAVVSAARRPVRKVPWVQCRQLVSLSARQLAECPFVHDDSACRRPDVEADDNGVNQAAFKV